MVDYQIVIVGAGIAGLYLAYKLQSKYQVLLIEKDNRIGGRIRTINDTKGITYEAGAARFSKHHSELIKLLKEFNLYYKKVKIPKGKQILLANSYNTEDNSFQTILDKILVDSKKLSKDVLRNMTLVQLCNKLYGKKESKRFQDLYHYYSEISILNCLDALELFQSYMDEREPFYILEGGLTQLVNILYYRFTNMGGKVMLNCELSSVQYENNLFTIVCNQDDNPEILESDNLILTIGKIELKKLKILRSITTMLNTIQEAPLLRIYAIYPKNKTTNKVWFDGLKQIVTDLPIKYIIPIDSNQGLIMISYTDGKYAKKLLGHIITGEIKNIIKENLDKLFPELDIPLPSYFKTYYWSAGGCYWKPGVDSRDIEKKMIKPLPNTPLYICGENYSRIQAWMEGALVTSTKVLKYFKHGGRHMSLKKKSIKAPKKIKMTEVQKHNTKDDAWIVIDDKVYNITDWIPRHPGGPIIMHGVGKDASQMFKNIGHSTGATRKLKTFYIGDLEK